MKQPATERETERGRETDRETDRQWSGTKDLYRSSFLCNIDRVVCACSEIISAVLTSYLSVYYITAYFHAVATHVCSSVSVHYCWSTGNTISLYLDGKSTGNTISLYLDGKSQLQLTEKHSIYVKLYAE